MSEKGARLTEAQELEEQRELERMKELLKDKPESVALVDQLLRNFSTGINSAAETAEKTSELTPEMADQAITALRQEFDTGGVEQDGFIVKKESGYRVQAGMDFGVIESTLRDANNTSALLSVYRMVEAGAQPAVVCSEGGRFCIAETFGQTLSDRANCVYDKAAEELVGRQRCNGNAVDQATKMGVRLMESDIATQNFVRLPDRKYSFDYLQANKQERESGYAPCLCRGGGGADVGLYNAGYLLGGRGWRGALWVQS